MQAGLRLTFPLMNPKLWLLWFVPLGLAWAQPAEQGQVRVHFRANQPIQSVEVLGRKFLADESGQFLLPLGESSNLGNLTLTVFSTSGATCQLQTPSVQAEQASFEVHFASQGHPWAGAAGAGFFVFTVGLGLGYWRWARGKEKAIQDLQSQDLAEADLSQKNLVGKVVGRYRITGLLGQGGMASVYRASPQGNNKEVVALKVISQEAAQEEDSRERFSREIQVSLKLDHPNVIRVIDWGIGDEGLYLALECIDGDTLREKIRPEGLPLRQAMAYIVPICEALEYAHHQGVVHRDLKPENVMVTHTGKVKLMDFGLARSHQVSTLTMTGQALGSPAYMPPEQVTDKLSKDNLDPRSDQYSLGIVIYELLCGKPPFEGQSVIEVIMQQIQATPQPLGERVADLPPAFEGAVMRALSKEPADRFASVADLRAALLAAIP